MRLHVKQGTEEKEPMVIPAGHGPIPRVAKLSKAYKDPKGTPRTHPEKKGGKEGLGEGRREREQKGGALISTR